MSYFFYHLFCSLYSMKHKHLSNLRNKSTQKCSWPPILLTTCCDPDANLFNWHSPPTSASRETIIYFFAVSEHINVCLWGWSVLNYECFCVKRDFISVGGICLCALSKNYSIIWDEPRSIQINLCSRTESACVVLRICVRARRLYLQSYNETIQASACNSVCTLSLMRLTGL
jgi:hypothetical protein